MSLDFCSIYRFIKQFHRKVTTILVYISLVLNIFKIAYSTRALTIMNNKKNYLTCNDV